MPGLEEIPADTLTFDKPEGRIIESFALMHHLKDSDVTAYYTRVLPAFGWGAAGKNRFFRQSEMLEISFETGQNGRFTKITIRPSL